MKEVYIKDFEEEGRTSAEAIDLAIHFAKKHNIKILKFEAKEYNFDLIKDDSGNMKKVHVLVKDFDDVELIGEVDESGNPLTVFIGKNPLINKIALPSLLKLDHCDRAKVKNIVFTLNPYYGCLAEVIEKDDSKIRVKVIDGPVVDGMAPYCMNRFDLKERKLLGISVTYGADTGTYFKKIYDDQLEIENEQIAKSITVGEGITWHFGADTFFQTQFVNCKDLYIENLRTINCGGFAMITEYCHNVTAKKIIFKPNGRMLFTGPRDAWKIYRCSGYVHIDEMYVEGVRMDGQNIHGQFLTFETLIHERCAIFKVRYGREPLERGSKLKFWREFDYFSEATIQSYEYVEELEKQFRLIKIEFEESITDSVTKMDYAVAECWQVSEYHITKGNFVNIAGSGHVLRIDNVTIEKTNYINNMMPAIHVGAEWKVHKESTHPRNIVIRDCYFENSGYFSYYDVPKNRGAISIGADNLSGPYNKNITIENNVFKNNVTAISVCDAEKVTIKDNQFENNKNKIVIHEGVKNIVIK